MRYVLFGIMFLFYSQTCLNMTHEKRLLLACQEDNLEEAKGALAQGAQINCKLKDGTTPLCLALSNGNYEMAHLFLQRPGIDVNAAPKRDGTLRHFWHPIHIIMHDWLSSKLTKKEKKGRKALRMNVFKELIKRGANINIQECWNTPLHTALEYHDNISLIRYLIDIGAQILPDSHSYSPLILACNSNNRRSHILAILRSPFITLKDLLHALSYCESAYDVVQSTVRLDSEQQKKQRRQKGRVLKGYYFTMKNMGYVHPKNSEWQVTPQCPFLLEVAKLISYYAAWNAKHSKIH